MNGCCSSKSALNIGGVVAGFRGSEVVSTSQVRSNFTLNRVRSVYNISSPLAAFPLAFPLLAVATGQSRWQTANQDPAHHHHLVMGLQEDEADHPGDAKTATAIETIETIEIVATDHEAAAASSGRKSAKMIVR
jgi:hypothetical protein